MRPLMGRQASCVLCYSNFPGRTLRGNSIEKTPSRPLTARETIWNGRPSETGSHSMVGNLASPGPVSLFDRERKAKITLSFLARILTGEQKAKHRIVS